MRRRAWVLGFAVSAGAAVLVSAGGCSTTSKSTSTPTDVPTATYTFTETPTYSVTRTHTRTETNTYTISNTHTATRTSTPSGSPTNTRTDTQTGTPTCPPGTCSPTNTPSGPNNLAVLGGFCSSVVHVAPITGPGTLGAWTTQPAYPISFGEEGFVAVGNCLFSVAGYNCSAAVSSCYASTASGGTLSAWTTVTAYPVAAFTNHMVEDAGFVFSFSGYGSSANAVYRAMASGCSLSAWTSLTALPVARDFSAFVKAQGYVYYLGGDPTGGFQPSVACYYATISSGTIGAWTTTTALPSPGRFGHELVTDGSYVYVIGGGNNTSPTSTIYAAQILGGGALGSWATTTALPAVRWFLGATVVNGYLYVTAGGDAAGATSTVFSATIGGGVVGSFTTLAPMPIAREDHRMVAF